MFTTWRGLSVIQPPTRGVREAQLAHHQLQSSGHVQPLLVKSRQLATTDGSWLLTDKDQPTTATIWWSAGIPVGLKGGH